MGVFRGLFVRKDATRGTEPAEARKALAGLFAPVSAIGARPGMLYGPGDPLRVSGTASWQYEVNAGPLLSSRGDVDGVVLFGNDGTALTPAVSAAPGSGSRWDLIYLRHQQVDAGGGETSDADLGVVSGAASGTPVKPAVPAGAVVLAEALVSAGATSTAHANVTITQVAPYTAVRGAPVPVRNQAERDALPKTLDSRALRLDKNGLVEQWDGSTWVGSNDPGRGWRAQSTADLDLATAPAAVPGAQVSVPMRAGAVYVVRGYFDIGVQVFASLQVAIGQAQVDGVTLGGPQAVFVSDRVGARQTVAQEWEYVSPSDATRTVRLAASRSATGTEYRVRTAGTQLVVEQRRP